jgi:hypothetical protein
VELGDSVTQKDAAHRETHEERGIGGQPIHGPSI